MLEAPWLYHCLKNEYPRHYIASYYYIAVYVYQIPFEKDFCNQSSHHKNTVSISNWHRSGSKKLIGYLEVKLLTVIFRL